MVNFIKTASRFIANFQVWHFGPVGMPVWEIVWVFKTVGMFVYVKAVPCTNLPYFQVTCFNLSLPTNFIFNNLPIILKKKVFRKLQLEVSAL